MVKVILLDTETTGLPRNKKVGALESNRNWPDLVSICWFVYEDTELQRKEYHVIRPEGWRIGADSANIHGISHETAMRDGEPLQDVLALFRTDATDAYLIAAHNLHFDKNVLFHAYKWRLGQDPSTFWRPDMDFCSAEESRDELKLPFPERQWPSQPQGQKQEGYKTPRLDELYVATFQKPPPANAHNAERDVEVLADIMWARWTLV